MIPMSHIGETVGMHEPRQSHARRPLRYALLLYTDDGSYGDPLASYLHGQAADNEQNKNEQNRYRKGREERKYQALSPQIAAGIYSSLAAHGYEQKMIEDVIGALDQILSLYRPDEQQKPKADDLRQKKEPYDGRDEKLKRHIRETYVPLQTLDERMKKQYDDGYASESYENYRKKENTREGKLGLRSGNARNGMPVHSALLRQSPMQTPDKLLEVFSMKLIKAPYADSAAMGTAAMDYGKRTDFSQQQPLGHMPLIVLGKNNGLPSKIRPSESKKSEPLGMVPFAFTLNNPSQPVLLQSSAVAQPLGYVKPDVDPFLMYERYN